MLASAPNRCQLLVLPMVPAPTFAFAFLHEEFAPDTLRSELAMSQALWQFDETLRRASASRLAGGNQTTTDLSTLSARELEIITRLMNGDRVPAIAGALFLSPSTVRNHLSAVFHKLGVGSQQELINLLRKGRIADQ
jgi:DNA-binding NarL/FixJ family response regulator